MKVHYLFSRNEKLGSRLICWVSGLLIKDLEKIPSHVAVLLDEHFVMESVAFGGVRCVPYSYWKSVNEECYKISCGELEKSKEEVAEAYENIYGKGYDWSGILYFSFCFIRHFLLNYEFPKINKWQNKNKFFCTEFAGRLSKYKKYSMTTPAKMCLDLLNKN